MTTPSTAVTLPEPSPWRLIASSAIAITAGVLANLVLVLFFGKLPPLIPFVVSMVVVVPMTFWLNNLFYNKPMRAYRAEKQRLYEEQVAREEALREAKDSGDLERIREIEAQQYLFGSALRVRK